jgi:hypothetical protein
MSVAPQPIEVRPLRVHDDFDRDERWVAAPAMSVAAAAFMGAVENSSHFRHPFRLDEIRCPTPIATNRPMQETTPSKAPRWKRSIAWLGAAVLLFGVVWVTPFVLSRVTGVMVFRSSPLPTELSHFGMEYGRAGDDCQRTGFFAQHASELVDAGAHRRPDRRRHTYLPAPWS